MITIEHFEGLPTEHESFLINRYNSFITTCRYIEIYHPDYYIYYMLVYEDSELVDLLIFGNKGNTARCFNALVNINQNTISGCINLLFIQSPFIQKVMIDASLTPYKLKYSFLITKSEDYVINLPTNINDYYKELGLSTRRNLKSRKNKLLKNFNSVNYFTKYNCDINDEIIDKIVQMNYNRMKYKGVVPHIDNKYKNNIFKYSQHYGCASYLELDGEMVAGCIATILNKDIFLHVFSHDNNFSKYNVGESCVFNLITTAIENDLSTFHFLWGSSDLKSRFQVKPTILFSSFVYRGYSLDFFTNKLSTFFLTAFSQFKLSAFSKPLKKTVKFYRKINSKV